MPNLYLLTNLITGEMALETSDEPIEQFRQTLIEKSEKVAPGRLYKNVRKYGGHNFIIQSLPEELKSIWSTITKAQPSQRGSLEHRQKIAAHWNPARRAEQGEIARRVNEVENKKLKDYVCPDCGQEFEQVTKSVYGGHRKACLYWQKVEKWLEQEESKVLDEILET